MPSTSNGDVLVASNDTFWIVFSNLFVALSTGIPSMVALALPAFLTGTRLLVVSSAFLVVNAFNSPRSPSLTIIRSLFNPVTEEEITNFAPDAVPVSIILAFTPKLSALLLIASRN